MKMIFLILMTATLAYGCGSPKDSSSSLQIKNGSIVGGQVVDPLKTDTSFIVHFAGGCAGSIIEAKWILTAAHCKTLFNNKITGGSINLKDSSRVKLKILRSYIHPKYSKQKSSHDFALIELAEEIDFNDSKLQKIEIADSQLEASGGLEDGLVTTVYGWGLTTEDGSLSNVLREVNVPLVSRARANAADSYNGKINESMLAAGFDKGAKDSCQGDSGGPMVVIDEASGTKTLIGVVSFGDGCARAKKYGIYSNVSYANEWIQSIINQ